MADVYLALYEGCQSPPQWAGGGVSRPVDEPPSTTFYYYDGYSAGICCGRVQGKQKICILTSCNFKHKLKALEMVKGHYIRAPGRGKTTNIFSTPYLSAVQAARTRGFGALRGAELLVGTFLRLFKSAGEGTLGEEGGEEVASFVEAEMERARAPAPSPCKRVRLTEDEGGAPPSELDCWTRVETALNDGNRSLAHLEGHDGTHSQMRPRCGRARGSWIQGSGCARTYWLGCRPNCTLSPTLVQGRSQ